MLGMEVSGERERCHRCLWRGYRSSILGLVGMRDLGYAEPQPALGTAAAGADHYLPVGATARLRLANSGLDLLARVSGNDLVQVHPGRCSLVVSIGVSKIS